MFAPQHIARGERQASRLPKTLLPERLTPERQFKSRAKVDVLEDSGRNHNDDCRLRGKAMHSRLSENSFDAQADDQIFRDNLVALIPSLRSFARGLCGRRDMADDLAQEAMMRGWAARASFAPGSNFRAWMFMILRNQFYTTIRKDKRMTSWDPEVAERVLVEDPAQDDAIHLADVAKALQMLPAAQREVLMLVEANGVSYEEAAQVTGCPIGTIKSRVARGRQALALLIDGPNGQALFDRAAT